MTDTVTKLNKDTVAGGDVMDESLVPNSHPEAPGGMAKRARVALGDDSGKLVDAVIEGGVTKLEVKVRDLEALNSLVPGVYDYIQLGYTGEDLTTVTYKSGGPGGTIVSTLTLAYSGGNLVSVTKS